MADTSYFDDVYKLTNNYVSIQDNYYNKYAKRADLYTSNLDQTGVQDFKAEGKQTTVLPGHIFEKNVLNDNTINKADRLNTSPSLRDGYQSDINEMIVQQNTVYIISSIAVSALLIMAIVVGRG